ncbi:MAG TPA: hypothetical protein VKR06_02580 [Ktedonosporobacter sp.]|nr:hypothetical protein [Ktedonosporobacter sp.]
MRTVILLPFATSFPEPPFVVRAKKSGKVSASQDYEVILLCQLDARKFIEHGHVSTYSLLPAMQHASVPLLKQAMLKMRAHYSDTPFRKHMICLYRLVEGSATMSEQDKKVIKEVAKMQYGIDRLLKGSERVAQLNEQAKEEGRIEEAQQIVLDAIQESAPKLVEEASKRVAQMMDAAQLRRLALQIARAPDEATVRNLLKLPSA